MTTDVTIAKLFFYNVLRSDPLRRNTLQSNRRASAQISQQTGVKAGAVIAAGSLRHQPLHGESVGPGISIRAPTWTSEHFRSGAAAPHKPNPPWNLRSDLLFRWLSASFDRTCRRSAPISQDMDLQGFVPIRQTNPHERSAKFVLICAIQNRSSNWRQLASNNS